MNTEESVVPVLDYLERRRLFGPGKYDWLCEVLAKGHLRLAVQVIKDNSVHSGGDLDEPSQKRLSKTDGDE